MLPLQALHRPGFGPLIEQSRGLPQLTGPQFQLAQVEGQHRAEQGLAALVGQHARPAQQRPRLADMATEGKLGRRGAVERNLIEAGVSRHPPKALGRLLDRMTAQDAGPGEGLLRMLRDLGSGGPRELERLDRQRLGFGDPVDPDQREQQRLRRQRGRPQRRIGPAVDKCQFQVLLMPGQIRGLTEQQVSAGPQFTGGQLADPRAEQLRHPRQLAQFHQALGQRQEPAGCSAADGGVRRRACSASSAAS